MKHPIHPQPDGAHLARDLHARPGIGVAAQVMQQRGLEILRVRVEQAALIFVDRGIKTVQAERGHTAQAHPGQALVLSGNQTVDFTNSVPDGTHYEARWLVFDSALLEDPYYLDRSARIESANRNIASARSIARVRENLADAFERARQSLPHKSGLPDPVVRQRVLEVMHWLLEQNIVLRSPPVNPSVAFKVRALISTSLDDAWTAERIAIELAQSEATLRRRLAAEGTTLTQVLADTRMAAALTLLQATTQPVSQIALSVGYESASRFAVRFRQRFGFAPTAVRGHERAH